MEILQSSAALDCALAYWGMKSAQDFFHVAIRVFLNHQL